MDTNQNEQKDDSQAAPSNVNEPDVKPLEESPAGLPTDAVPEQNDHTSDSISATNVAVSGVQNTALSAVPNGIRSEQTVDEPGSSVSPAPAFGPVTYSADPAPLPISGQSAQTASMPELNNPMTLFLQWLTYALWGWALLPLIWLIFAVVFAMFGDNDMGEAIIYPLAAIMVLLPAAIVMDFQYSKREPKTKKGASLVIMLIHAVIFVLFGIGFLIGAVFSCVSLILNSDSADTIIASIISCGIVALLYAVIAVRTIKPSLLRPGWNNGQE